MDLVETSERASNLLAIENEQLEENNGSARLVPPGDYQSTVRQAS